MQSQEYETMFRAEEAHWWYSALHQLIFDSLDESLAGWQEKDILDAGCGTGAILQRLGNPEKHIGIDLAPEALSFCRKRGLQNVSQANICALPFTDNSFDAVICSSVLYHEWVPDVGAALRELQRVLRPDGKLFANFPAYTFLHSAHDDAVMTARRFRKREVTTLIKGAGFRLEKISFWTTFLFPLAVLARTLRGSRTGRDFGPQSSSRGILDPLFLMITRAELAVMKRIPLPFGVALFAVAAKP